MRASRPTFRAAIWSTFAFFSSSIKKTTYLTQLNGLLFWSNTIHVLNDPQYGLHAKETERL